MPRRIALHLPAAFLLLCAAMASGCWVRVRGASYAAPIAPSGGGEVHGVYLARPGYVGGGAAGGIAGGRGTVAAASSGVAWAPGAGTGGTGSASAHGSGVSYATWGSDPGATSGVAGHAGVGVSGATWGAGAGATSGAAGHAGSGGSGEADAAAFASSAAGWTWSAATGWTRTGGGAGAAATVGPRASGAATPSVFAGDASATTTVGSAASGSTMPGVFVSGSSASAASGASLFPPRRGGAAVATGAGVRLSALATVGVTVSGCACSEEGEVAALSRLVPLAGASLGAGTVMLGDAAVSVALVPAHDALGPAGGATSIAVVVRGGAAPATPPPLRVHLVIDASTSMRSRWPEVKDAALALVGRLRPTDELQIVVYGDGATVALAPAPVGDGRAARAVVRGLRCGGRTNIEAGLRAAYDATVSEGSIVLLLSDGVPLGGAATPAELGALAAAARAAHGATTFAIGLGNEFHPGILHALATAGGGDFRIAPRTAEVEGLLAGALEAHGRIVARDVAVDLELPAGVTLDASAALAAGLSASGGRVHLAVPSVAAGSEVVVMVPVVAAGGTTVLATADASWSVRGARASASASVHIAAGAETVVSGGVALSLDAELGAVLADVATFVENGDGAAAQAALDAHAAHADAIASVRPGAALTARAHASRALGFELDALVPAAGFAERRQTAAAILEWSLGFCR